MTSSNQTDWPAEIAAITLFQEDLQAAKHFYADVLQLPLVFEDANSAVYKIGATLINLLNVSQAPEVVEPASVAQPEAGSRLIFTIGVDDVDVTCAELTRRGASLLNGPMDRPWGIRTAAFQDPGGHIWEIAK
jgi:lactoylglutathione lyase